MTRLALLFALLPSLAAAWEFTPRPICTLAHAMEDAAIKITHDPTIPEYRMEVRLAGGAWAASPSFGVAFEGGRALTIGTDRHQIAGGALSVADRGFDNVLYGLEHNLTATTFTASQFVTFPLNGAAPEVERFRACASKPPALS